MSSPRTIALLIFLVLGGTLVLLFVRAPEEQTLTSADGAFRFETSLPSSVADLTISTDQGDASTARLSPIYRLEPVVRLPERVRLSLRSDVSPSTSSLAWFSDELGAWQKLPTRFSRGRFFAEMPTLFSASGSFALLQEQDVTAPADLDKMKGEAMINPPPQAFSGIIHVAYATAENDFVLLPSLDDSFQCLEPENLSVVRRSVSRTVFSKSILVNGVSRAGWLAIIVEWNEAEHGCTEGQNFTVGL